jgi:hypothetical protein
VAYDRSPRNLSLLDSTQMGAGNIAYALNVAAIVFGLLAAACAAGAFYFNDVVTQAKDKIIRNNIGNQWEPLTREQAKAIAAEADKIAKRKIHIMHENAQGAYLARSIADAFRAADWEVKFSMGSGFGQGMSVGGDGSTSGDLKAAIEKATPYRAKEYGPGSAVHIGVGINPN